MSLIQNEFLQAQIATAVDFYNEKITPRLTTKNKVVTISAAVALSLIMLFREKVLKPPKKLRHIPYVGIFDIFKVLFRGETFWQRAYRSQLPLIESPESKGLFMEYGRGGWQVFVTNPEDVKRVLYKIDLFPKIPAPDNTDNTLFAKYISSHSMAILNGPAWKAQRKVANPAFHRSAPVKLFGRLTQELFEVMDTMDETVNVSDLMERWTLDAIGKAGFGFDFNAIRDKNSPWVQTYNTVSAGVFDPFFFLFPKLDSKYLWLFPKRALIHKELDKFFNMLDGIIVFKREQLNDSNYQNESLNENEKDLLTLMIESEKRGEGIMTNVELRNNLSLFFLAGHDTTSSALSFSIHYLAKYPEIQQKAREEVIALLGDEKQDVLPSVEETRQMVYLNQIIKETLRINGPIPYLIPRIAAEDTDLSGTFIPKGTAVNVNIFSIHHSSKFWTHGEEFNPDRFAEGGEGDGEHVDGRIWLPFSTGARQCIGMGFSLYEQRVLLSMLLRKFTWSTPPNSKHKNGVIAPGQLLITPDKLDITFKKRY